MFALPYSPLYSLAGSETYAYLVLAVLALVPMVI